MKPLIGITTGEIVNQTEPWVPQIYGQNLHYSNAILAAGGVPVFIPLMPDVQLKNLYERLDGIIFAGGNDIDPTLYGETQVEATKDVSPKRDHAESLLMSWAVSDDKPFFAICRGMQLFNVLLGGSLYQDIPTAIPEARDHLLALHEKDYTTIAHTLKVAPTSQLAHFTNTLTIDANSRHHQAVKHIGQGLHATAWSEDGIVEAIEHPDKRFAIGVQCHPEWLFETNEKWMNVFKAFITAANTKENSTGLFKLKKRISLRK